MYRLLMMEQVHPSSSIQLISTHFWHISITWAVRDISIDIDGTYNMYRLFMGNLAKDNQHTYLT
jgi:hypothetical protein